MKICTRPRAIILIVRISQSLNLQILKMTEKSESVESGEQKGEGANQSSATRSAKPKKKKKPKKNSNRRGGAGSERSVSDPDQSKLDVSKPGDRLPPELGSALPSAKGGGEDSSGRNAGLEVTMAAMFAEMRKENAAFKRDIVKSLREKTKVEPVKKKRGIQKSRKGGSSKRSGDRRTIRSALDNSSGKGESTAGTSTKSQANSDDRAERSEIERFREDGVSPELKNYLLNYRQNLLPKPARNWGKRIGPRVLANMLNNHQTPEMYANHILQNASAHVKNNKQQFDNVGRELRFMCDLVAEAIKAGTCALTYAESDLGELMIRKIYCISRYCEKGLWSATSILLNPGRYNLPKSVIRDVERAEKLDVERIAKRKREDAGSGAAAKKGGPAPAKDAGQSK